MLKLQNIILELVARGEELPAIARRLCLEVEARAPGAFCSVLEVDAAGFLHPVAGPSLPEHYSAALDGVLIGPMVGSCGSAAYLAKPVSVMDIASDPRWADFAALALPLGFRACWSSPILNGKGTVIGTFALYFGERRGPTRREKALVRTCLHLCAIALSHHHWRLEQKRRSLQDAMTGLPNRAAFAAALDRLQCEEPGSWGLLLIDLDNLKTVNDTFGHHVGDRLIEVTAERVSRSVAPDQAYRLGGDEFAVLVRNPPASANLARGAEAILAAFIAPAECGGHSLAPRATIGGASLFKTDMTAEDVRRNADFALYHAKETARGGYLQYWSGLGSRISRRLEAIRDVGSALHEGRLLPHYQPIFRLAGREVTGFEALCRMQAGAQLLPTRHFQEATTELGVATALTERMLELVARDVRNWQGQGINIRHVAVNLSSADFHDGQLAHQLFRVFEANGVSPECVVLELTEGVYARQPEQVISQQILCLRERGVRIALDNFGSGLASLTRLTTLPIDFVKIDKCLVDKIVGNRVSMTVVEGLLHIARELRVEIVAEGVETEEQAHLLAAAGCTLGQGYLLSAPLAAADASRLLLGEAARSNRHSAGERYGSRPSHVAG